MLRLFLALPKTHSKIDQYQQELELVVDAIKGSDILREYLDHLLIPAKEKKKISLSFLGIKFPQITLNFLLMVIDKRREAYIRSHCGRV